MHTGVDTVSATARDDDTGDGRPDDGTKSNMCHEDTQQQRVGNCERHQPDESREPGNDRNQHIAQDVGADLGEDLVADKDDAGPSGVGHQPVQGGADAGHVDRKYTVRTTTIRSPPLLRRRRFPH